MYGRKRKRERKGEREGEATRKCPDKRLRSHKAAAAEPHKEARIMAEWPKMRFPDKWAAGQYQYPLTRSTK